MNLGRPSSQLYQKKDPISTDIYVYSLISDILIKFFFFFNFVVLTWSEGPLTST